ncbi:unknown [Bacteroides sp. CAG:545]|nr:unknown [Bacteroides sp. CAG:545]
MKVDKIAGSFEVACDVKGANADPEVTVSEDAKEWLTASYADGKLTYSVKANEGAKRAGTVTVKAKGIGGEASAELKVIQASVNSAEYKLSVSASEVYTYIQAKIKELEDGGQTVGTNVSAELTIPFTAKGTTDPSKTTTVNLKFAKVLLKESTAEFVRITSTIAPTESVGVVSEVTVVSSFAVQSGMWGQMAVKFSDNGLNWTSAPKSAITSSEVADGYQKSVVVNDNSDYLWFSIAPDGYSVNKVKSFDVIFVEE